MPNPKSAVVLAGLALLIAVAVMPSVSCSHAPRNQSQIGDTIHLVTLTPVIAFHSDSTADSIPIWLSCSCRSTIQTLGSGGDVSAFAVTSRTPDTEWIIPHYLRFTKLPGNQNHLRAWYAFSSVDHFGQTDYDTIHVTFDAN